MPTEIPLKQWLMDKAQALGIGRHAVYQRLRRYRQWTIKERRVNRRVIYVDVDSEQENVTKLTIRPPRDRVMRTSKLRLRILFLSALAAKELELARKLGYDEIPGWK